MHQVYRAQRGVHAIVPLDCVETEMSLRCSVDGLGKACYAPCGGGLAGAARCPPSGGGSILPPKRMKRGSPGKSTARRCTEGHWPFRTRQAWRPRRRASSRFL